MAMVDVDSRPERDELDDLSRVERRVDGLERAGIRSALLGDRERHLAERRADRVDPGEVPLHQRVVARHLGAHAVGALDVDDPAVDEPFEGRIERRELVHRETILGVVGVQEVEGVLEIDVVSVASVDLIGGFCFHLDNHSIPIDRLRARGYITEVTDKTL